MVSGLRVQHIGAAEGNVAVAKKYRKRCAASAADNIVNYTLLVSDPK